MLKKDDGRLDFNRPAAALERQIRAFQPWPGAFLEWQGAPLKVHRASILHPPGSSGQAGQRVVVNGLPAVVTADGILVLEEVQPPGKARMPGKAFLAGGRAWQ